jgi:hypothetical protein
VPLALARLTYGQLSRLAAEEPSVRWPRALRVLVTGPNEVVSTVPAERDALPDVFSDRHAAPLLRRGLRAFEQPRLRLRVVLRQGRLLTLTEVAADTDGSAGSLSAVLLDDPLMGTARHVRPVGRVELAGTAASALPSFCLRHVPGVVTDPSSPTTPRAGRPGAHPARTLVLRGWGRALIRPFVDAWAQDEHGWVRPDGPWLPVDATRFADDLAAALADSTDVPCPIGADQGPVESDTRRERQ